jgi:hypothetical protein
MLVNDFSMFGQFRDPLYRQRQAQAETGFFANREGYHRRDDRGLTLNHGLDRRVGVAGFVIPVHAIPRPHRWQWSEVRRRL